jgi:ketosteroid isomerase-like protein
LTSSLSAETEALKEAYAALSRNDISLTVKAFDPQIEWTEPAEYPGAGTYHGHTGVMAHLSQSRANWAEGSCEPERFIVASDPL